MLEDSRTMIPVRALSEAIGAQVDYDATSHSAIVAIVSASRGITAGVILGMGRIIEASPTHELFLNPKDQMTSDYLRGRF